ncbi:alkaline phosphatase PhoX [Aestuariibacter sp. A3R04]|uniref:alkaline phosphatase PhoX n=1 Tax=Aestuariibacter sp. A3R04 TaxID=2841571 RepID=UPI001C07F10B|nr:alkaline phosphatase PhoX [Aestuariibacter sp. A3R04]MBU3023246.1 DUF839 domain-containing protein [Aestuariibacter sp. A3R04]
MITRRQFTLGMAALAAGTSAFSGLANAAVAHTAKKLKLSTGFGPLVHDPKGLLSLPEGFSYRVLSQLGTPMSDDYHVPDNADGMGCFALDEERVALVRNHELKPADLKKQPASIASRNTELAYDTNPDGIALPGGTTTLIVNLKTLQVEREFVSLSGTIRNCAGGATPWGSWLTCEENVAMPSSENAKSHGWVFEVPADSNGMVTPEPLKAMGRFNHEAAAVDPKTGIVYMTEDRGDSLFYRFIPHVPGQLSRGGKLQALAVHGKPHFDSRNWVNNNMALQQWMPVSWVDLQDTDSPDDDLRKRGAADGATVFARGEGIHWGDGELYFCCTNGGNKKCGQIMRYQPSTTEGQEGEVNARGRIQLFLESNDEKLFNFGDNLTVSPFGDLIVCEDQYTEVVDNYLRGVTPAGEVYPFARLLKQTELAGACFSPDGSTLFVNMFSPAATLAITGPWTARNS